MVMWFGRVPEHPMEGKQKQTRQRPGEGIMELSGWAVPENSGQRLQMGTAERAIGDEEVAKAVSILNEYKRGKANLEQRIIEDEEWYERRHWEVLRRQRSKDDGRPPAPEPTSAWLFNAIMNKHADAMDNYPDPNVLPREQSDQQEAKRLSSILPVLLEYSHFEQVYSDNWWEKLKHGTAGYGIFWNPTLNNGLGDIHIRRLDLLNVFWEPGTMDIQKSRNLFICDLQDRDILEMEYPHLKGRLGGNVIDVAQYIYDDTVKTDDKVVVVDWYYKTKAANGRALLHYAKFCGNTLLFASENDPQYTERGWYDHGEYPIVFDTLFPEKGTPVGFGYVSITKDPQLYIDKLFGNILESSLLATKTRYLLGSNTGLNKEQLLDLNQPVVDVEGELDDAHLRQIVAAPIDSVYVNVLQMKIDELKETSANRDVSSGGTPSGVTAAAAIAALQEAGNKSSRDMISASYRSYARICYFCIELIRQFYDETRSFRITEPNGEHSFTEYNNAGIREQVLPPAYAGAENDPDFVPMYRLPIFDITIRPQKRNPFSRMSQNELAKELYAMGFFNPERAQEALGALELMDFEGKDSVMDTVKQGQTILNICQRMSEQMDKMAALLQAKTGMDMLSGGQASVQGGRMAPRGAGSGYNLAGEARAAQQAAMTGYGDRLAARSQPNMNKENGVSL